MPSVRTVVRTLIAGVLAIVGTGVAGMALAMPALAAQAGRTQGQYHQIPRTDRASSGNLAIAIDSISPQYASPSTSTITVKGTVTNHTGRPLEGVQVELETSSVAFGGRGLMDNYAAGEQGVIPLYVPGPAWVATSTLHTGSTMTWTASFPASLAGYSAFGVYPIEAQALLSDGTPEDNARTFLPYWPGSQGGTPQKLAIAWVWPLIDKPEQGACSQELATNDLAASLAAGGRLDGLLTAGRSIPPAPSSPGRWTRRCYPTQS